jgi:hypothetical protein
LDLKRKEGNNYREIENLALEVKNQSLIETRRVNEILIKFENTEA